MILLCAWDTKTWRWQQSLTAELLSPSIGSESNNTNTVAIQIVFLWLSGENHYLTVSWCSNRAINAPFIIPSFSTNTFNTVSLPPLSPNEEQSSLKAPAGRSVHQEKLMFATTVRMFKIPVSQQLTALRWKQPDWLSRNVFCNLPTYELSDCGLRALQTHKPAVR